MRNIVIVTLIVSVIGEVCLVLAATQNGNIEPTYLSTRKNVVEDVVLRFFNGKTFNEFIDTHLPQAVNILQLLGFSLEKTTAFYIHGYDELPNATSTRTVVEAYLQRGDHNIIAVDWYNMATGSYPLNAMPNTAKVGSSLGDAISSMIKLGYKKSLIHVVGHSLGGQVAGFTGKRTKERGIILPRISALDPAFPLFYPGLTHGHITEDDAAFVDIIHTDAGFYGAPTRTGSIDFWPNGGVSTQPGCPKRTYEILTKDDLCSHWRSWAFWAESLLYPHIFEAVMCVDYPSFKTSHCSESNHLYMGYAATQGIPGNYYLVTSGTSPYGLGRSGMKISGKKRNSDIIK